MTRACIVSDCGAEVNGRSRLCKPHWDALPGRERSRLSLSARVKRNPVVDELWDKARASLEEAAA